VRSDITVKIKDGVGTGQRVTLHYQITLQKRQYLNSIYILTQNITLG